MADATPPQDEPQSDPLRRREAAFNLPGVVLGCCAVLLAIYGVLWFLTDETREWIIFHFGFVPARAANALGIAQAEVQAAFQHMPQDVSEALLGAGGGRWWSVVTYAFLHGSWPHVIFNCIWLAAFGSPVARRFRAVRFLLLLIIAAVLGAFVQFAANPGSFVPVVGASAAVAGAMGAATRFVFRPAGEAPPIVDRRRFDEAYRLPALTLRQTLTTRTALFFVVVWFVSNLVFGIYPSLGGMGDAAIAWQAHIGGFLAGLLLFPLFDPWRAAPGLETEDSADLPVSSTDQEV